MSAPETVYQIKVMLDGSKPPIWRRILVANKTTLARLHHTLQIVMGWTNSHLHMFTIDQQIYGDPEANEYGELMTKDEGRFRLDRLVPGEGFKFRYEYDFGDGWLHELVVEKILPAQKQVRYPLCIAGENACPPEDVGGIGGYADFLEALADPRHPEHDRNAEWIGGTFDPRHFDLDAVNKNLHHRPRREDEDQAWDFYPAPEVDNRVLEKLSSWVQALTQEQLALAESLAVRRDMVTLLKYFKERNPVGTQSTGNLQLKAVREVCAQFVNPPVLDDRIGDRLYKLRTEDDVWPLSYLHWLAGTGSLATGGQARAWRLTPPGVAFLDSSAPIQLYVMLFIWWHLEDWRIAYPVEGLSGGLPRDFRTSALAHLLQLKIGQSLSYEQFADGLIAATGFTWPSVDQTFAQDTLRWAIRRMVIDRLVEFGCLECEYRISTEHGYESKKLAEIRLTAFGKGLLGTL